MRGANMRTIPVPKKFVSFDEEGNVKDIDMFAYLNSLPEKQKLYIVIRALQQIQEEQYQGFKEFSENTPGNDGHFNKCYEAMGRMYFVLHSMIDDYEKL